MNSTLLAQTMQNLCHSRYNHDIIQKLDKFILEMPTDKWFKTELDETKIAVIKDWIDKDLLKPYILTLSYDYKYFKKIKL